MKLLVLSDSHGKSIPMLYAAEKYGRNADVIVHCGDATRGEADMLKEKYPDKTVVCVRGNCDWESSLNDVETLNIGGKNMLVTHGHLFGVKYGLQRLYEKAVEENCELVFFGHTHNPTDETIGDIRMINPGSCGGYAGSCATVEIDNKNNVLTNHIRIEMN